MTMHCTSYDSAAAAEEAVGRLIGEGVDREDVRVLMGAPAHGDEPAGSFAGTAGEARGTFAGQTEDSAMGSFAGDPHQRSHGSFATIDRETVTTFEGRAREVRDISHGRLKALLVDAGLDEEEAERDVQALHDGRVLVLVDRPG
jgi:hypothetical protein